MMHNFVLTLVIYWQSQPHDQLEALINCNILQTVMEGNTSPPCRRSSIPMIIHEENSKEICVWGNHANGELGVGGIEEDNLTIPTPLDFSMKVVAVSCGESHTAFILEDGTLWTCGSNDHGQLGHTKKRTRPGLVEGLEGRFIVAVSTGFAHTIAIDVWGACYTWGSDSHGQLGLGLISVEQKIVFFPKMVKTLALKTVCQIAAGHFHSLMLTNTGELYTCGSNSHGQLGLSFANGINQNIPSQVDLLLGLPLSLITAGGFHSFALSISGSVFGWGKNNLGQLGVSDTQDKCKPCLLITLRSLGVKYITAGNDHTAFLTQCGGVFTCGNGSYGQLGHSTFTSEVLPRKILEFGSVIVQVVCGRSHTLCLTDKNKLYSFGLAASGQLGLGNCENKNSPMPITFSQDPIHSVYAGGDQTFVIVSKNLEPSTSKNECLTQPSDYRVYRPTSQINRITDDLMNEMCSAVEPVDQDIMTNAETIFASPAAWNCSFLLPDDGHIPSTWKNMGVDLVQAGNTLSKLEKVKAAGLRDLIDGVIYKDLLPKLPHQLKHVEILRVYVLLPLLPTFYLGSNYLLPVYYANRIQALELALVKVVVHWFFDSPIEQLERLISVYKKIVVTTLDSNQTTGQKDTVIRSCLQFLSLLHKHNKHCLKLSYHTFTIPQITDKIQVQQDYFNWLQLQEPTQNRLRPLFFCDYAFVFDASAKTILLQSEQRIRMENAMRQAATPSHFPFPLFQPDPVETQFLTLVVSRQSIVQNTISCLYNLTTDDLKKPLRVKFLGEEAEDAGGVKKEFFLLLIREILDPKYGMFHYYEDSRLIWFRETALEDELMYYLIGLLCGLAIYNFTIINLSFPLALYKKLLREKVDLLDFKELNPVVGKSFESMLEYSESDFEDVFTLYFEMTLDVFGTTKVVPLKPNGSVIAVTQENKVEFVDLYVDYVLNVSVQKYFESFKEGFNKVCGNNILPLFHAQELQAMVTGNQDYDWGDLERSCSYKGVYSPTDPTIVMFWEVFHKLSLHEKKQFLLFLTGSDRIPILGMKALKIFIQPAGNEKHLPVAHTCFNLLDLPRYQTSERLRYKLTQAIQHNQGFSMV